MNDEIIKNPKNNKIEKALCCPICKSSMQIENMGNRILVCNGEKKHCYDFSSSGYVNMAVTGKVNTGDSKQAVRARSMFLDAGYYAPIKNKLCEILNKYVSENGIVIDAGCGEGYYSNAITECGLSVLGFDLSKFATDFAAKRVKRSGYSENSFFGVSSVYTLPVFDRSANAAVNIFAPCVEGEYARVIDDDGVLIVVYAGPDHLMGLKSAIYKEAHKNEDRADMPKSMLCVETQRLRFKIDLKSNEDINNLFAMTPYYWKTSKEDFEKLDGMDELTTEIDILFSIYKKQFDQSI